MLHGAQVVSWTLVYTKQAQKDAKKIASSGLRPNVERLLGILAVDPFRTPPPYETPVGNLKGAISRRINIQHRLVYLRRGAFGVECGLRLCEFIL